MEKIQKLVKHTGSAHTREHILEKIRRALASPAKQPYPSPDAKPSVFRPTEDDLCMQFAYELRALQGNVLFCSGREEFSSSLGILVSEKGWRNVSCLSEQLVTSLQLDALPFVNAAICDAAGECDAGITDCESLIARTGTIVMSSGQPSGRAFPVYTPVHIVVAWKSQILPDLQDAFDACRLKFSSEWPSALFFASGPSRTGDIEKTLVLGVHGPVEVYVFILEDEPDNRNKE